MNIVGQTTNKQDDWFELVGNTHESLEFRKPEKFMNTNTPLSNVQQSRLAPNPDWNTYPIVGQTINKQNLF